MSALSVLQRGKWFLSGFAVFAVASLAFLLYAGRGGSFIQLNPYHSNPLNIGFYLYTYAGDGIFALCLVALFWILGKKEAGYSLLLAYLLSGLVAQLIKHFVDSPRPRMFFLPGQYQHFIDGVSLTGFSGFPSGHTATAFALAAVLSFYAPRAAWQLFFLLAAVLVGYSRIYLGQHFLSDVLAGATIGVLSAFPALSLSGKLAGKIPFPGQRNRERYMNGS